jgi:hypothetical protein
MEAMEAMEVGVAGRANIAIALLECGVVTGSGSDKVTHTLVYSAWGLWRAVNRVGVV